MEIDSDTNTNVAKSAEADAQPFELPNFHETSCHAELTLDFPQELLNVVKTACELARDQSRVPPWPMLSPCPAEAPEVTSLGKREAHTIAADSPIHSSTGGVLEAARREMERRDKTEADAAATVLTVNFLKDLLGSVYLLGLATSTAEHDLLAARQKAIQRTANIKTVKSEDFAKCRGISDAHVFCERLRRGPMAIRYQLSYFLCFLPVEYLLRFLTMLPAILKNYASLYTGYLPGTLDHLKRRVEILFEYIRDNGKFAPVDTYEDIPKIIPSGRSSI